MARGQYETMSSFKCTQAHALASGEYRFQAVCQIEKCKPGLVKDGHPAKCLATGKWSTGQSCVVPKCKELPVDNSKGQLGYECFDKAGNRIDSKGEKESGSICKVICRDGWRNAFRKLGLKVNTIF